MLTIEFHTRPSFASPMATPPHPLVLKEPAGPQLLTGVAAAATAAYCLSDVIFAYEAGDDNAVVRHVEAEAEAGNTNVHGRVPTATYVCPHACPPPPL